MRFGRLLGRQPENPKPNKTSTQPGGSSIAQFLPDESTPVSTNTLNNNLAIPHHFTAPSTLISPLVSTRGGDSEWDPYTPGAELPPRRASRLPWKKSSGPKAAEEHGLGYFTESRLSVADTGSEGITPGSLVFSDPSPASTVATPPSSPFSLGSIRRKTLGLRPAASSPNLAASDGSRPFVPTRRHQHTSTLSSLWEPSAPVRPRRGSDVESTISASPFGVGALLGVSRDQSPAPNRGREPTTTALPSNRQLRSDAREIIDMENDLELAMALTESLASPRSTNDIRSRSSEASPVWRHPSPTPSDYSDDLVLYRGRDSPRRRPTQRASPLQHTSPQEELDREYAQRIQKEEEERALSLGSSSQTRGLNPFNSPTVASSSSKFPRESRSGNPWVRNAFFRSAPEPDDLFQNPLATAASSRGALNADELLARQLQAEENSGVPRHVSRPQVDNDMALAMQLEDEENQHLREMNAAPKTRDCAVCGEGIPIPDLPSLMNCEHEPQVCSDCYQHWIASELNNKSWKEIKCPEDGCKEILHHAEVQQYATPEVYAKFDALSAREALNDDPNFRWCSGQNCASGQIHESDVSGNIFECIECGYKVCTVHEGKWHEGETCEEYDYRTSGRKERDQKLQDAASVAAISKLTKKCPGKKGKCGWNIEKNDGCDHMTCTKCKYQFCWICMADYQRVRDQGNSEHATSCKYHSSQLPDLSAEQAV